MSAGAVQRRVTYIDEIDCRVQVVKDQDRGQINGNRIKQGVNVLPKLIRYSRCEYSSGRHHIWLQARSSACSKQLFEYTAGRLLTVSRQYTPKGLNPMDNLQDSFIKIFDRIYAFDVKKGSFRSWARRIVISTALDKLNKRYQKLYWNMMICHYS
ncbi:MAG: sigma-70 family RNA polymerase sigma factor [Saprospiraceae bacterium]|nr:sigma-70 family RNA polymerase sigma factor [Saprospiraceae bacterium]